MDSDMLLSCTSFLRKLFSALSNCLPFSNLRQGDEASNSSMDNNHNQSRDEASNSSMDNNHNQSRDEASNSSMDNNHNQSRDEASNSSMDNNHNQSRRYTYDVFISFRGADTRNTFVDHLYAHLTRKGLRGVWKRWLLLPNVGVYQNDFVLHKKKFIHDPNKVVRWTKAMEFLANLVGWDVRNKPESIEIETIVQAVIKSLNHKFSRFTNDLVGMRPRIEELEKLLQLGSMDGDFRVLGILGMSGVGKTTHAMVLYDRISYQFDVRCFINNTNKLYMDDGIVVVQRQILRQALDERI
ncbi:unnamed protein product [Vicia faba]|uniref:TIR domain-containing protein n=1 Tax=Vicia faba TaxID=3906 RepID=A0AAV0Z6B2_VICFA|nr:unnamed protein product [Vicia faba]